MPSRLLRTEITLKLASGDAKCVRKDAYHMNSTHRDVKLIAVMLELIETPEIRRRIEKVLLAQDADAPPDRVLTAAEAGKMLGVTSRTVFNFAKQGLVRRVKYPGRTRAGGFRYSDISRLLERSVVGA